MENFIKRLFILSFYLFSILVGNKLNLLGIINLFLAYINSIYFIFILNNRYVNRRFNSDVIWKVFIIMIIISYVSLILELLKNIILLL